MPVQLSTELPIGWKRMSGVVGDPLDAGTPEEDWSNTSKPRAPRKEVRFWYRGDRYIRICQVDENIDEQLKKHWGNHGFCIHIGWLSDGDDEIKTSNITSIEDAERRARNLMRIGGY